jgi:hypothetical protein
MLRMCVCMHSRFIENHPIWILEYGPLIYEVVLSQSLCVWSRPHTILPDLLIIRPPSTRPVLDHPRSSTPGLLLLPQSSSLPTMWHLSPAHHETRNCDSPHEQDNEVKPPKSPGFKFKLRQVITHHNQTKVLTTWFLCHCITP